MLRSILICFLVVISFTLSVYANESADFNNPPEVKLNVEYIQDASIAKLSWTCKGQSDIKMFVCEKSTDGKTFEEIARVVEGDTKYLEFDEYAADDIQYYRVVTYLHTGEKVVSAIQEATKQTTSVEVSATFFPNPVIEQANIHIANHNDLPINIAVYSSNGEEVYVAADKYGDSHSIDCKSLTAGTYFIKAQVGEDVFVEKIDIID